MNNITRFDLEQQILNCWSVTDDINHVYEAVMNKGLAEDIDKLSNILLGMKELYHLKFEQMWDTFEQLCRNREL